MPRKNIRPLCGKPLLAYTAEAAQGSRLLTRVVLTTDDLEIAEVGRQFGLVVPFVRPAELAQDDTPTLPVVQHAVRFLEAQGEKFEAICLLQPTHPLRPASLIDECIQCLLNSDADSVVSVKEVPSEHNPHWVYFRDEQGFLRLSTGEATPLPRRQLLPPAFHRDGSVYVTRREVLMEQNSLYGSRVAGVLVDPASSINIDTPTDWAEAERAMTERIAGALSPARRDH